MRPVIEVQQVSKCYPLAREKAREETLINQLLSSSGAAMKKLLSAREEPALHWALKDVSFTVNEGEAVSIIGHNGAGKSTMLKILSRITAPSEGQVRIRGRVASLLEVGTGFHPDLTGRENIYLNAAILGLKRAEIQKRFDDIVDFSDVAEFIDLPIRNYSSGMKVRLGFSVAAHIDPEVLIIDEVLAVGDNRFQQRCLNRVEQLAASGRTILYVSHQLPSVLRLSKRCILLDHGRIAADGPTADTIRHYEETFGGFRSQQAWDDLATAPGDLVARLRFVELTSDGQPVIGPVSVTQGIEITIRYDVLESGHDIMPSLHFYDFSGIPVLSGVDLQPEWHGKPRSAGTYQTVVTLPANLFNDGNFRFLVALTTLSTAKAHAGSHNEMLSFTTYDAIEGHSTRGLYRGEVKGFVRPPLDWKTEKI